MPKRLKKFVSIDDDDRWWWFVSGSPFDKLMPRREPSFTVKSKNNNVARIVKDVPKSKSDHDCLLGINEKLLFTSCCLDESAEDQTTPFHQKPKGWYATSKAYRSVAYKTWTVGAARKLLNGSSSLDSKRNGFISDSDSNLEDEQTSSCRLFAQQSEQIKNNRKFKLRDVSETRALEISRRENANRNYYTDKKYDDTVINFDSSTTEQASNVDRQFRAVVDTFKDLQNFIAASKTNYNKRTYVNKNCLNDNNNISLCANCSIVKSFNAQPTNSNELSIDNKNFLTSFDNVNQAIQYVKNELV